MTLQINSTPLVREGRREKREVRPLEEIEKKLSSKPDPNSHRRNKSGIIRNQRIEDSSPKEAKEFHLGRGKRES